MNETNPSYRANLTAEQLRALVARGRSGDRAALSELYNGTCQELFWTVRSMLRDRDGVEDVVQDAYIRAFQSLDQLQDPARFLPWLKRIAGNLATDRLRRQQPTAFSQLADDQGRIPDFADPNPYADPARAADQQETARLVREILNGLSDAERMVVGLYYYEQMPVKEIAQHLGTSQSTVKVHLYRGRKKIKTQVEELEKQGTKLYGMTPLAFFAFLLDRVRNGAASSAAGLGLAPAAGAGAAGTGAVSAASLGLVPASAATAKSFSAVNTVKGIGGLFAKLFLTKAAAAVTLTAVAATVAVPVTAVVLSHREAPAEPAESVTVPSDPGSRAGAERSAQELAGAALANLRDFVSIDAELRVRLTEAADADGAYETYSMQGAFDLRGSSPVYSLSLTRPEESAPIRLLRAADGTCYLSDTDSDRYTAYRPAPGSLLTVRESFLSSLPWQYAAGSEPSDPRLRLTCTVGEADAAELLGRLETLGESLEAVGLGNLAGVRFDLTLDRDSLRMTDLSVSWAEAERGDPSGRRPMLYGAALRVSFSDYGKDLSFSAPAVDKPDDFSAYQRQWILTAWNTMRHQYLAYVFPPSVVRAVVAEQAPAVSEPTASPSESGEDWSHAPESEAPEETQEPSPAETEAPPTAEPDVPALAEADRESLTRFLKNCYASAELGLGFTFDCEKGMPRLLSVCTDSVEAAVTEGGVFRYDRAAVDRIAVSVYHQTRAQLDAALEGDRFRADEQYYYTDSLDDGTRYSGEVTVSRLEPLSDGRWQAEYTVRRLFTELPDTEYFTAVLGLDEDPDAPGWSLYRIERRTPEDFDWHKIWRGWLEQGEYRLAPASLELPEDGSRTLAFRLADLDGDLVPELLLDTQESSDGSFGDQTQVLTLRGGEVRPAGSFSHETGLDFYVIPDADQPGVFCDFYAGQHETGGASYLELDPEHSLSATLLYSYEKQRYQRVYTWSDADEALKDLVSAPQKLPMRRVAAWTEGDLTDAGWEAVVAEYETRASDGALLNPELPDPEGLEDFLHRIFHYADGHFPDGPSVRFPSPDFDVLEMLVESTSNFTNTEGYHPLPYPNLTRDYVDKDPQGRYFSSARYDRDAIDWICRNIFHLTDREIADLAAAEEQHPYYYADGDFYYAIFTGRGYGGTKIKFLDLRVEGDRYLVEFYGAWLYDPGDVAGEANYIAELGHETIDGVRYWTLYSLQPQP